jgi:hypothetical protein
LKCRHQDSLKDNGNLTAPSISWRVSSWCCRSIDGGGTRGNGKTKCIELNMPFFKAFKHILATEGVGGVYQSAAGDL